jgi:hypothetical protein
MFGHDENNNPHNDKVVTSMGLSSDPDISSPAFTSSEPKLADEKETHDLPKPSANPHRDDPALLNIKQSALQQLTPLVGHLDQTPEEKFRTTMMMIQASDNQDLIKEAYEAAQAISDEKTKAQALLDIVNEINYFTQHKS